MTDTKTKTKRRAKTIDQRDEIKANEITVVVTMPGDEESQPQAHTVKLDASEFETSEQVADAARDILLKLLEA